MIESFRESSEMVMRQCLEVKGGEVVTVIVDRTTLSIGESLHEVARDEGAEVSTIKIEVGKRHGQEPPRNVASAMRESDVVLAPTAYSLSHTQARKIACSNGARIATMPMITDEIFVGGSMRCDYVEMARRIMNLREIIADEVTATLTSDLGTDLVMDIDPERWVKDDGVLVDKGAFGNLPAGELFCAPLEGTCSGKLVVDGSMAGIGNLENPLMLIVESGKVTEITGERASELVSLLESAMSNAARSGLDVDSVYSVAELGVGANPGAAITGNPLEDEKVLGTAHVALGDNSTFGGKIKAGVHLDGIIRNPTLRIGDRFVLKDGFALF